MAREDELLQRVAAAAIPHKLGRLYSRYGQPAPALGEERTAPVLGREAIVGGRGVHAGGQAGRPESLQPASEEERGVEEQATRDQVARDQDEYQAAGAQGRYQGEGEEPEADDESPEALAADHSNLMDGLRSLQADDRHVKLAEQFPAMGPEDFWRLYGHEIESKYHLSRDDFFAATGEEP